LGKAYLANNGELFNEILLSIAHKRKMSGDLLSLSKEDKANMSFIIQNWAAAEETTSLAIAYALQDLGRLEFSFNNSDDTVLLQKLLENFVPDHSNGSISTRTFLTALLPLHFYDPLTPEKRTYLQSIYLTQFQVKYLSEKFFMDNLKSWHLSRIAYDQLDPQVQFHIQRHYQKLLPGMSSERRALVGAMLTNLEQRMENDNDVIMEVSKENNKISKDLGEKTEKLDLDTDNVSAPVSPEAATIPNEQSSSQPMPTSVPLSQPTTILPSNTVLPSNNTNNNNHPSDQPISSIHMEEAAQLEPVSTNDHLQKQTTSAIATATDVPPSSDGESTNPKEGNTSGVKPLTFLAVNSLTEKYVSFFFSLFLFFCL
jgi:hypothetical protein